MSKSDVNLKTYTIQNWISLMGSHGFESEQIFWVGGRVQEQPLGVFLTDARFQIELLSGAEELPRGPWLAVSFKFKDFQITPSGECKISNVLQHKTLSLQNSTDLNFINSKADLSLQKKWSDFLCEVKNYFNSKGFTEIFTPSLVTNPGPEPTLDPFMTEFVWGDKKQKVYLPTSPEIHLKKAIAAGFTEVFEVKPSFRNSEVGTYHEPEFYMLEWYQAFISLPQFIEEAERFIIFMQKQCGLKDQTLKFKKLSVSECFKKFCDFDLTPKTTREDLQKLCSKLKIDYQEDDHFNDVFFRIFLTQVEPRLAEYEEILFIYNYPPTLAALAKIDGEGWASRFEIFWKGVELANAFDELTNPDEQLKRAITDNLEKLILNKNILPVDLDFIQALQFGLPPSCGIALGLERLFCLIHRVESLEKLKLFSWSWKMKRVNLN